MSSAALRRRLDGLWISPLGLGLLCLAAPARAQQPQLAQVRCEFDGGHQHLRAAQLADGSPDDELRCRVTVKGLATTDEARSRRAVELALVTRDGTPRTVASGLLEDDDERRGMAVIDELIVPRSTWEEAVRRDHNRRPFLHLVLRVFESRRVGGREKWTSVLSHELRIGDDRSAPPGRRAHPPKATQARTARHAPRAAARK